MTAPRLFANSLRHCALRRAASRCAFTLIELLIVIGVIMILVALTVTVTVGLTERAEVRNTENVLTLLDNILGEYELARGRPVSFGINGEPSVPGDPHIYEVDQRYGADFDDVVSDETSLEITDQFFAIMSRSGDIRSMIATIPPEFVEEIENDDDNDYPHLDNYGGRSFRFVDAWGNPILAIHPGRRFNPQFDSGGDYAVYSPTGDPDGSIRTPFENRFGVAANRRMFFVSAGPNDRFGNLFLDVPEAELDGLDDSDRRELERARDNIYSYDVLTEQARPQQ